MNFLPNSKTYTKWRKVQKKIKGQYQSLSKDSILFFVASRGEFEQALPVIEAIKKTNPEQTISVSFFSPSGYEPLKNHELIDFVFYTPYDSRPNVKQFLDRLSPKIAIFVKYELWLNMMFEINKRSIPVYLISGVFHKGHFIEKFYGTPWRKELTKFSKIYVQDVASKIFLEGMGINSIHNGDTRIERSLQLPFENFVDSKIKHLDKSTIKLILGSIWPEDIQRFIDLKDWMIDNYIQLIIAPHELDKELLMKMQQEFNAKLYSDHIEENESSHIIIDKMGILKYLYRYADIAYIGGGFGKGIHNTLEPASYGVPVIFGPNHQKFIEAIGLQEVEGGFTVSNSKDIKRLLEFMILHSQYSTSGKKAFSYLHKYKGATKIIMEDLYPHLS